MNKLLLSAALAVLAPLSVAHAAEPDAQTIKRVEAFVSKCDSGQKFKAVRERYEVQACSLPLSDKQNWSPAMKAAIRKQGLNRVVYYADGAIEVLSANGDAVELAPPQWSYEAISFDFRLPGSNGRVGPDTGLSRAWGAWAAGR